MAEGMSEQLSAIERYRAQWKPNETRIADLHARYKFAVDAGAYLAAMAIWDALWREMRPPRHLPIKYLDIIDDPL